MVDGESAVGEGGGCLVADSACEGLVLDDAGEGIETGFVQIAADAVQGSE